MQVPHRLVPGECGNVCFQHDNGSCCFLVGWERAGGGRGAGGVRWAGHGGRGGRTVAKHLFHCWLPGGHQRPRCRRVLASPTAKTCRRFAARDSVGRAAPTAAWHRSACRAWSPPASGKCGDRGWCPVACVRFVSGQVSRSRHLEMSRLPARAPTSPPSPLSVRHTGFCIVCALRTELRKKYNLPEEPMNDCLMHFPCCSACAVCQVRGSVPQQHTQQTCRATRCSPLGNPGATPAPPAVLCAPRRRPMSSRRARPRPRGAAGSLQGNLFHL